MGGKESQSKLILQHIFRFIMCKKKNIYIYKKSKCNCHYHLWIALLLPHQIYVSEHM